MIHLLLDRPPPTFPGRMALCVECVLHQDVDGLPRGAHSERHDAKLDDRLIQRHADGRMHGDCEVHLIVLEVVDPG